MAKTVNVALIGTKFMGKSHSNAFLQAPRFFDMKTEPVMKVICGYRPQGHPGRGGAARLGRVEHELEGSRSS